MISYLVVLYGHYTLNVYPRSNRNSFEEKLINTKINKEYLATSKFLNFVNNKNKFNEFLVTVSWKNSQIFLMNFNLSMVYASTNSQMLGRLSS